MNNHFTSECKPIYRIGVDFDLTLVDSLHPWIDWFNNEINGYNDYAARYDHVVVSHPEFKPITKACYTDFKGDLAILMRERAGPYTSSFHQFDPMSWWRLKDLYDNMLPLTGALTWMMLIRETLMDKHNFSDVEFVCVSKCEPEHERSKRRFLPTHFPDIFSGFISTDDKHMVAIDCLIDDNPKYIKSCRDNGIFQIYIPQGNYELFPDKVAFVDEMLFVKPDHGKQNHFEYLIENNSDVCDILVRHYGFVR